jgi:hypothetical protein
MSTKQNKTKKMTPNNNNSEEGDFGVLIYRESELGMRKAKAALLQLIIELQLGREPLIMAVTNQLANKAKMLHMEHMSNCAAVMDAQTKLKKEECAKRKLCSSDGFTNIVVKGGVCITHGATWTNQSRYAFMKGLQ